MSAPSFIPSVGSHKPSPWRRRAVWSLAGGVGLLLAARLLLPLVPMPQGLDDPVRTQPPLELLDRAGRSLRIASISNAPFSRPLAEADVPPPVVLATLAAEDARFRAHPGFDPLATLRAAAQWVRHRRVISGASTITQQLVKLASPKPRPRTLRTKLIEVTLAARLELEWDKDRILRAYLARIDYGNRCAGIAEAAHHYFGKAPGELDLAEASFLAAIPQAPTRLNPRLRFDRTRKRQEWILGRCLQLGWIDAATHEKALATPIRLAPPRRLHAAPHFTEFVLEHLPSTVRGGRVETTLDLPLQEFCQTAVREQVERLRDQNVHQAAVVVLDNLTGGILAMVGSPDWHEPESGQVNGTLARRSPGSALKPFTYLLAFQDGAAPADIVPDISSSFATATGIFAPLNYDHRFRGPVSLREALAGSLNVPAVRVLHAHGGPQRLRAFLQDFGIGTLDRDAGDYGLGLTLGDGEVRLLELANAYATLARRGEWIPAIALKTGGLPAKRVARADECWWIADILSDPTARAASFGMDGPLNIGFQVACKTGTSSGFRDNWALGYTPEVTVGVWVGNFDGSPMRGISGVTGAAPLLRDIFRHLNTTRVLAGFAEPKGVTRHSINPLTGRVPAADSGGPRRSEPYIAGRSPLAEQAIDRLPDGRVRLDPEYAEWAASTDNRLGTLVGVGTQARAGSVRILEPPPGTVFLLDADRPAASQRIRLLADLPCLWTSGTLRLGTNGPNRQVEVPLTPGIHRFRATAPDGAAQAESWIEVREL